MTGGFLAFWTAGYNSYGFSALFKPMASEIGLNRAAASVAASMGRLEGGFEAPVAGWLTDKFGPKWIVLSGVLLFGISLILMNFVNSAWSFYLVWGFLLGMGANIAGQLPMNVAISNWFVRKRGLALGIKWGISGLGLAVMLPFVVTKLIITQGWRISCVVGGLVMLVVGLPSIWFSVKTHRAEYYGLLPDGAIMKEETTAVDQTIDQGVKYAAEFEEVEFSFRQILRTPAYWLLLVIQAVRSLATPAINIHGIPFLTDIGIDPLVAAGMLSTMIAASIPIRFVGGFLIDRVKKDHLRFLVGGAYLLQAIGFFAIMINQTTLMIYIWLVVYGIGLGAILMLDSILRARYFGRKAFGSNSGLSTMLTMPAAIVAPVYLGWVYDTTGSYLSAFKWVTGLLAFSAVLMFLIRPPKPPAQVTDVHNFF